MEKMKQSEAKKKGLHVYNNGKVCKNKHNPTLRFTSTGRCMYCSIEETRIKDLKKRNTDKVRVNYYYVFKYPNGGTKNIGPYSSQDVCVNAYLRHWKVVYGYAIPNPLA